MTCSQEVWQTLLDGLAAAWDSARLMSLKQQVAALKEGLSQALCEQDQLYKVSKSKEGIVKTDRLAKHWTDWVDYWVVDFNDLSRKEVIKVQCGMGVVNHLPSPDDSSEFEMRWTGGQISENEWQSFRTRQCRDLELTTAGHNHDRPGRFTVAVKDIDSFGIDTMMLVPVSVGYQRGDHRAIHAHSTFFTPLHHA